MKILVVGSGGREHAVVAALSQSTESPEMYAAPGNGGIRRQAEMVPVAADDVWALLEFARNEAIDLTFVGPEIPLSKGIVDIFRKNGLRIVGPTADGALLESSKSYAKKFFKWNHIPTADFWECSTAAEAYTVLAQGKYPIVIKADGLAAGKGVVIAEDESQAHAAVRQFMEEKALGDAGSKLVIEEFLRGEEASVHVFADGTTFQPMVAAQDHKRRFDNDTGPNTGGMGAYSTDSIISEKKYAAVISDMIM